MPDFLPGSGPGAFTRTTALQEQLPTASTCGAAAWPLERGFLTEQSELEVSPGPSGAKMLTGEVTEVREGLLSPAGSASPYNGACSSNSSSFFFNSETQSHQVAQEDLELAPCLNLPSHWGRRLVPPHWPTAHSFIQLPVLYFYLLLCF